MAWDYDPTADELGVEFTRIRRGRRVVRFDPPLEFMVYRSGGGWAIGDLHFGLRIQSERYASAEEALNALEDRLFALGILALRAGPREVLEASWIAKRIVLGDEAGASAVQHS